MVLNKKGVNWGLIIIVLVILVAIIVLWKACDIIDMLSMECDALGFGHRCCA